MTFIILKISIGFLLCVSVDCQPKYVLENDHGRIFLEEIVDKGSGVIHFNFLTDFSLYFHYIVSREGASWHRLPSSGEPSRPSCRRGSGSGENGGGEKKT